MNPGAGSEHEPADSPASTTRDSMAAQIRAAAGFLTILPVMPISPARDETVAASLKWFPAIGFALGAMICVIDFLLGRWFGSFIRSLLTIAIVTAITGAVHLDGLADTADALGAGRDRARALTILRDSRIGSFGAIALFFALALKIVTLASIAAPRRYVALYFALGLSRWAMIAVAQRLDYLRAEGAGSALLTSERNSPLPFATLITAVALLSVLSWRVIAAVLAALAIVFLLRAFYRRWLGGVTGDLIGACGELVELTVLLAMSVK